jgi:pyrroloquinoline-quinone synthase
MKTEIVETSTAHGHHPETQTLEPNQLEPNQLEPNQLEALFGKTYSNTREALIHHPLWEALERGEASLQQLQTFALQDHWLVGHSLQLEALLLAYAPDEAARQLLASKLSSKQVFTVGNGNLLRFGQALGLSSADFEKVQPLAGCAALTSHFYYALAREGFLGMLTAITVSESVFIAICQRAGPALQKHYHLNQEEVAFFTLHDALKDPVDRLEVQLIARLAQTEQAKAQVQQAAQRSFGFEKLFYDTVFAAVLAADESQSQPHLHPHLQP